MAVIKITNEEGKTLKCPKCGNTWKNGEFLVVDSTRGYIQCPCCGTAEFLTIVSCDIEELFPNWVVKEKKEAE